jgi:biotin operon repressor
MIKTLNNVRQIPETYVQLPKITIQDCINAWGEKAESRSFCIDCADYHWCQGLKKHCKYRDDYMKEVRDTPENKRNLRRRRVLWSDREDEKLISLIRDGEKSAKEMAKELNRTYTSVITRIETLKKKGVDIKYKTNRIQWTDEMTEHAIDMRDKGYTNKKIAEKMGIRINQVDGKMGELIKKGLIKRRPQGKFENILRGVNEDGR